MKSSKLFSTLRFGKISEINFFYFSERGILAENAHPEKRCHPPFAHVTSARHLYYLLMVLCLCINVKFHIFAHEQAR